jgi:DNA invertase Pin-like site-specific DNA recombinase
MDKTPAEQPKRTAIYTRISMDKTGEKAGVTRQLEDCVALAASLKWGVVAHYDDNDISAYSGRRRPGFEDLLDGMKTGAVNAVICWDVTRLYRSMKDLERFIEIAEPAGISIKTVKAGELDLSTSAGRMVARILGSVARQESEHHGERRSRACMQKAGLGVWETANRPFGYGGRVKCRDAECGCGGYHQIGVPGQPLEPEAQAIRDAVADVLDGTSIRAIARRWNEAGLTTTAAGRTYRRNGEEHTAAGTWTAPRIRRILANPRYAGLKVHRGKVAQKEDENGVRQRVTGNWEALIDVATHDRLVAYLTDPARITTTSFERKFPGAGIYRCSVCGGPLRSDLVGGKGRARRHTYVCRRTGGHVLRAAQKLDDFVANAVLERLAEEKLIIAERRGDSVGRLQDDRAQWVSKLDTLVDLLDDGTLDGPRARERAAQYRAEIAAIDRKLAAALRVSPAARMLASGEDLRQRWEEMDATLRSQVIDELAVVTVKPTKRGPGFDPDAIDIRWKP